MTWIVLCEQLAVYRQSEYDSAAIYVFCKHTSLISDQLLLPLLLHYLVIQPLNDTGKEIKKKLCTYLFTSLLNLSVRYRLHVVGDCNPAKTNNLSDHDEPTLTPCLLDLLPQHDISMVGHEDGWVGDLANNPLDKTFPQISISISRLATTKLISN